MGTDDIGATTIAAGLAGTITLGTLIVLILQNVKAITGERLQGPSAEMAGGAASLLSVAMSFHLASANWRDDTTYAALFIAWMAAWVSARSTYALLFKASVQGVPVPSNVEVPKAAVDDPYEAETRKPVASTRAMTDDELLAVSRRRA